MAQRGISTSTVQRRTRTGRQNGTGRETRGEDSGFEDPGSEVLWLLQFSGSHRVIYRLDSHLASLVQSVKTFTSSVIVFVFIVKASRRAQAVWQV